MDVNVWVARAMVGVAVAGGVLLAAPSAAQVPGPALRLSAATVEAGGTIVATGDCGGLIANTTVHVYVFRLHPQDPPGIFNELFRGDLRSDGSYEIALRIPAQAVPGAFRAVTSCTYDGDQVVAGDDVDFEVTASSSTVLPTSPPTLVVSTTAGPMAPSAAEPAAPVGASPSYTG